MRAVADCSPLTLAASTAGGRAARPEPRRARWASKMFFDKTLSGVGQARLRQLPRPGPRVRAAQRSRRCSAGGAHLDARRHARRAVAALQGMHAAVRRPARQPRRHQRARPRRRLHLGRPRRDARRAGAHPAARRQRDGQWQRGRSSSPACRRRATPISSGRRSVPTCSPIPPPRSPTPARRCRRSSSRTPSFHPYSSKFDLYAGNKIGGTLTPAEARGLKVFSDPKTGNCASCHYQGAGLNGSSALFTDFSYEAIGVPRNARDRRQRRLVVRRPGPVRAAPRRPPAGTRATSTAACSRRRRCATSPRARASSTTA